MARAGHGSRAAFVIALVIAATGACSPSLRPTSDPSPSSSPAAAVPLTPADVQRRLRTLDPELTLVSPTMADDAGVFPDLAFQATTPADEGIGGSLHLVFVYPDVADRVAAQPMFHATMIEAPGRTVIWDGPTHSNWVGVHNVIVEVVLPGGAMGGGTPTPEEAAYPDLVREALDLGR